jgi:Kef-type K+ transport system membrane component KefB
VGELFPIIAIAILLGSGGSFGGIASLVFMSLVGLALVAVPRWLANSRVDRIVASGRDSTSQTTLRITVALLVGLLLLAEDFGIDVVLGAFIAGMVLRKWGPSDPEAFDAKLDAIGYGFFIPIFFVASGMTIEIDEIAAAPERMLLFFVLLLVVRGGPTLLMYRSSLPRLRPRTSLTFLNATALPLIVALTEIGLQTGVMLPENAAALVGAGALSVLVFPLIATRFYNKDRMLHPDDYVVSAADEQDLLPDLRDGGEPPTR